ncbi:MAG: beta-N-acetylhexosaminidase [Parvibaculaceae bacterium]
MTSSAIYGCAGLTLTEAERQFFKEADPWGFIIFARNIDSPDQVRALTAEMRALVGWPAPILIDQEGGRVARLRPPHWREYPPARVFGEVFSRDEAQGKEAAKLGARLIAEELFSVGVDVDCLPVLDVPVPGAHDVIGNRAYGLEPEVVSLLGQAAMDGLLEGGVLPVIKHIPGHGRAGVDSHEKLPVVDTPHEVLSDTDFAPFKAFSAAPLAMTAHVIYTAIDRDHPATTSARVIDEIIRGEIGFSGCLMSDDLSMQALDGSLGERARTSLDAGCDLVLHCNGDMAEMEAVAGEAQSLAGDAAERAKRALDARKKPDPLDVASAVGRFSALTTV